MSRTKSAALQQLLSSNSGTIAPLFGLIMMIIVMVLGVTVDTARGARIAKVASAPSMPLRSPQPRLFGWITPRMGN